jgi:hypothetical protein
MLRVCPALPSGAEEKERVTMGTAAVTEELPGADELDELYRLDASEPEPEPEDGDEDDEDDEDEDAGPIEPGEMPHPIEPEEMPHP